MKMKKRKEREREGKGKKKGGKAGGAKKSAKFNLLQHALVPTLNKEHQSMDFDDLTDADLKGKWLLRIFNGIESLAGIWKRSNISDGQSIVSLGSQ